MAKLFVYGVLLCVLWASANVESQTLLRSKLISETDEEPLGLPKNSTLIRANIVDTFSCEGKPYGYYADVDNECQIFHVCQTAVFDDGRTKTQRWSFICPPDTIFNQEYFQCARTELSAPCATAPQFYYLNDEFGKIPERKAV